MAHNVTHSQTAQIEQKEHLLSLLHETLLVIQKTEVIFQKEVTAKLCVRMHVHVCVCKRMI